MPQRQRGKALVVHVTLASRMPSIMATGLRCDLSQTKRQAVYFTTVASLPWARKHVAKRHKANINDVVHIYVVMPMRYLHRIRRGLYYCLYSIELGNWGAT